MSEESAAQWYFDPPDEPWRKCLCDCCCQECCRGDMECPCDGPDLEEEPPELEDYMMRKRGLIE